MNFPEPTYVNEAYIMFHMAMSSLEPLPLETFMSAVDFVVDNKGIYSDDQDNINFSNAGISDSVINHLRRLNSRSGGLLEAQVVILDTSAASPQGNATGDHGGTPINVQTGYEKKNRHTPPREMMDDGVFDSVSDNDSDDVAVEQSPQSVQYVEFLHATAKDYIRNNHTTILVEQIYSPFVDVSGHDFLFWTCMSCESWVSSIKKDLLYYAKMAEVRHNPAAQRNDGVIPTSRAAHIRSMRDVLSHVVSNSGRCDFSWWLQLRAETFFNMLEQTRGDETKNYVPLILAVAGNLKYLVQELLSSEDIRTSEQNNSANHLMSLVYVAAVGPDLVPAEHHDRVGMIKLLVSWGYDVDGKSLVHFELSSYLFHIHGGSDIYVTPLWAVLFQANRREDPDETTLRVAECLLEQGASPNSILNRQTYGETMLGYCVRRLDVAFVRLLLRYGAETNPVIRSLKPAHYAAIQQDKAIIEAVHEFGGSLKPNRELFNPETDYGPTIAAVLGMGVWGSIGHPAVGIACAQASSWSRDRVKRLLLEPTIEQEEAAINRPSTVSNS